MSRSFRRAGAYALALVVALVALCALACGGGSDDGGITGAGLGGSVASVTLNPTTVTLELGGSATLQAQALDAQGHALPRSIVWSSSDSTIVKVSVDGRVVAVGVGSAEVAANAEGKYMKAAITVRPPAVAAVQLSPDAPRLLVGARLALTARTLQADGTALTGRKVTWSSSDPRVVTVDSAGVLEGRAAGVAVATATSEGKSASVTVTVVDVPVASIAVAPNADTIVVGQSTQLVATARDSAGLVLAGRTVSWTTSDATVATVSAEGIVLGVAAGAADITASAEGRAATAHVVVRQRPVASVIVSPSTSSLQVGDSVQLTSQVTDASGAVIGGVAVTYASSDAAVARVTSSGLVVATGVGTATITAAAAGRSGTATVTVSAAPVASLDVRPALDTLFVGDNVALQATARDAAGNVLAGRAITWTSGAPGIATVAPNGMVTGTAVGTAVILATSGRASATATITVLPVPVAAVQVIPSSATMLVGDVRDLAVTVLDARGNALPYPVAFASSDPTVATVSSAGRVLALAIGTARITATAGGVQGVATISVIPEPVVAVAVSGMPSSLAPGATAQLAATPTDRFGKVVSGRPVTWSSGNPAVATVSSSGLLTAVAPGTAVISATVDGITGSATATVAQAPPPPPVTVASVTVALGTASLQAGQTTQATATALDASGTPVAGQTFTWATSDPNVATVSASGAVTAVAAGTATISASTGGQTGAATLTVTAAPPPPPPPPPTVASVTVSLGASSLTVGQTTVATATLKDASGNVIAGTVTWSSSNPSVASVAGDGTVTALAAGTTSITASTGSVAGSATLTVNAPPPPPPPAVASVTVTLGSSSLIVGGTTTATATLKDANGTVLTGTVTWATSDASVATVSSSGVVTAVGVGSASITATSGGVTGSASLSVSAPPPAPVASVTVTLGSATLTVGQTTTASATLKDASGNVLTGRAVTWTTSNAAVALVSSSGQVTAVAPGTATITATSGGVSGSASLTVQAPVVARINVSPGTMNLRLNNSSKATGTIIAVAQDANGIPIPNATFTWATSDATVATVAAAGPGIAVVTGLKVGDAVITVTSGSASATVDVRVR